MKLYPLHHRIAREVDESVTTSFDKDDTLEPDNSSFLASSEDSSYEDLEKLLWTKIIMKGTPESPMKGNNRANENRGATAHRRIFMEWL